MIRHPIIMIHDPFQSKIKERNPSNNKKSKKQKATTLTNFANSTIGGTHLKEKQIKFIKNEKFKFNQALHFPNQEPSVEKYKIIYIPIQKNQFTSSRILKKGQNVDNEVLKHILSQSKITQRNSSTETKYKMNYNHNQRNQINENKNYQEILGQSYKINEQYSMINHKKNKKFTPIFQSFQNFNGFAQTPKLINKDNYLREQKENPVRFIQHSRKQTNLYRQFQNLEQNEQIQSKCQKNVVIQKSLTKESETGVPRERFIIDKRKRNKIFEIKENSRIASKIQSKISCNKTINTSNKQDQQQSQIRNTKTQYNKTITNSTYSKQEKLQNQIQNKTPLKNQTKNLGNTPSRVVPIQTKLIDKKKIEKNFKILDEVEINKGKHQELEIRRGGVTMETTAIQGKDCFSQFMVQFCI